MTVIHGQVATGKGMVVSSSMGSLTSQASGGSKAMKRLETYTTSAAYQCFLHDFSKFFADVSGVLIVF
jgi:hypothetical protein